MKSAHCGIAQPLIWADIQHGSDIRLRFNVANEDLMLVCSTIMLQTQAIWASVKLVTS